MTNIHLPFQQMPTFCGVGTAEEKSMVVVGAPVDCATTFRSGARMGPQAIRQSSLMLTDGIDPIYKVDLKDHVQDIGNMALPTGNTEAMLLAVESYMDQLKSKNVLTLGGDHSVTYAILKSLRKTHGPVSVIHFDAHCDTWQDHFGEKNGHGTWAYRAIEEGLVNPNKMVSIGIRSPADEISASYLDSKGGKTYTASHAMQLPPHEMIMKIWNKIKYDPVYLTFDIDCIDPSQAPGTGTPEIGGLSTIWLRDLFNQFDFNFIGMDIMEVAPAYDVSEITSLAAATFGWQYLSCMAHKMKKNEY